MVEALKRRRLSGKNKMAIVTRQLYHCAICHIELPYDGIEYDHILPLCLGGGNELRNWQALCVNCHKGKSRNEVRMKSKADRTGKKQRGEWRVPQNKLPKWRGTWPKRAFQKRNRFA